MSIIGEYKQTEINGKILDEHIPLSLDYKKDPKTGKVILGSVESPYKPSDEEREMRYQILERFRLSDVIMRKPRREWNDLSTIQRMMIDQMGFNTYQPNNGEALPGDLQNKWKSRAMKPVIRNKVISIAAHTTAQLMFPKVFAYDQMNEQQEAMAIVMRDLMEWAANQSDFLYTNLFAIISALVNPAGIVYTDYSEVYRKVKTEKVNGKWQYETVCDPDLSGFNDTVVPVDELYIEDFYQNDVQRQGYLIWRRVKPYSLVQAQYGDTEKYPNFKYVKPGVQVLYNDANTSFYEVYDSQMRQEMCEEIIYWEKARDLRVVVINGIVISDFDEANPRKDKLYPFTTFGFEPLDEGKCFYYKSLAFKAMQDANIVNKLYPIIIDGSLLQAFPPQVNAGTEKIGSEVIIPGAVTTISPESKMTSISTGGNLSAAFNAMSKVEESLTQSADESQMPQTGRPTAYELQMRQKDNLVLLGPFVQMIMQYVKDFGRIRLGDIVQYQTVAQVTEQEGSEMVYKSFFLPESSDRNTTKKLEFTAKVPETMSKEEYMNMSNEVYKKEGGKKHNMELWQINPIKFRNMSWVLLVSSDIFMPLTEEAKSALKLEIYDRAIANPLANQEECLKEFLFGAYQLTKKNPEKFINKQQGAMGAMVSPQQLIQQMQGQGGNPSLMNKINPQVVQPAKVIPPK